MTFRLFSGLDFFVDVILLAIYFRYPEARSMNRKIIFHAGPTNSGKTYHALERFLEAKSGVYCGPLKLLATEIYHKSNKRVSLKTIYLYSYRIVICLKTAYICHGGNKLSEVADGLQ